ncbi:hypothetical protein XA68_13723 [Ophiocordyceps unilateralis]|uniref:Uncharacterized protein n=1 Tax=Ophiocordyceps unilateralis TaxID=268505 RepID=A0A2A9PC53_OPHUN|nr:hypothetical protein XA68_13723 [Ophiocordyceps unilateralis]
MSSRAITPYGGNYPGWFEVCTRQMIRHVDAYGLPYWTRRRKKVLKDDPETPIEFFRVSDLLLDLDADEATTVRPFRAEDELQMRDEWKARSERAFASAQVKQMANQIRRSRSSLHQTFLQTPAVWRITPHDILSAALLGRPVSDEDGSPETEGKKNRSDLRLLCDANGIPPQALTDDRDLLRWLLLRRRSFEHSKQNVTESVLHPRQVAYSLRYQNSVPRIRRLVNLSLSSQNQIVSFDKVQTRRSAITSLIRQACDRVLAKAGGCRSTLLETLTFLGNLWQGSYGTHRSIGSPLLGLALRLSAQAGELEVASEWLKRFYELRAWDDRKTGKDVMATLDSLRCLLGDGPDRGGGLGGIKRQLVLQLLAGLKERGQMAPESLRGVLLTYLEEGRCENRPFGVYTMYGTYLELLGRLGAGRLLWSEWRVSGPLARSMSQEKAWSDDMVNSSFGKAVCQFAQSTARGEKEKEEGKKEEEKKEEEEEEEEEGEARRQASVEECAWLDYDAISATTWHGASAQRLESEPSLANQDASALPLKSQDAVELLELPLDEFVREVREGWASTD